MRRWRAGWTRMENGILLRVVPGKKAAEDLRLEWQVPGGEWRAVTMAAGAIMADFWYENEDVLYPRAAGFKGGEKYAQYLGVAMREGWGAADAVLQSEKAASKTSVSVDLANDPFADLEF